MCSLWRDGRVARDTTGDSPQTIKLPDERHGVLFVFEVYERVSYALVMQVREPCARATVSANPDSRRMDRAELSAWLRLLETPGIGLTTARRLLLAAGSAEGVFELPAVALASLCSARQREALANRPTRSTG